LGQTKDGILSLLAFIFLLISSMPEIIKYNVGGIRYEVSHSLIRRYPKSLLAKTAFSPWNRDDKDEEIFIERDGDRFRYVLDYLRDGLVFIPATVAKEAVMLDLNYYGVDYNDEVVIGTEACNNSYEPTDQLETNLLHFIHQSSRK